MLSKATIRTQVLNLVGNNQAIAAADVNTMLEADHLEILESWEWTRREVWTLINTIAPTTFSVDVTIASGTVLGAGFTAAMVGRLIRLADTNAFYRIASVVAGVSCVIGDGEGTTVLYPGVTATVTAKVWQHIYSMPANAEIVTGVYYNVALEEVDPHIFDTLDPERISEGDPPVAWGHFGRAASDILQIVLFPLPSAARTLRVTYMKVAALTTDSDTPLYRPDVLKWKSAESAAAFLLARTGDQAWAQLADRYHSRYEDAFNRAKEDDILKSSAVTRIQPEGPEYLRSDQFALDHDVRW